MGNGDGNKNKKHIVIALAVIIAIVLFLSLCKPINDPSRCTKMNIKIATDKLLEISDGNYPTSEMEKMIWDLETPPCYATAKFYFTTFLQAETEVVMMMQLNNFDAEVKRLLQCAPRCD